MSTVPEHPTDVGEVTKLALRQRALTQRDQHVRACFSDGPCPDAERRLFDFSIELRDLSNDDRAFVSVDGLQEAAATLLAHVQKEDRAGRGAFELPLKRLWAIYALLRVTGSHAYAKRFELECADGEPLTVCFGTSPFCPPVAGFQKLQLVQSYDWGRLFIPVRGCHAIIPESKRLGGVMWRNWCEGCTPNKGAKTRAQKRAHLRAVNDLASFRRHTQRPYTD